LGQSEIENFIEYVITEYYPENAGEYLKKKRRLLEQAKKGRKGAKRQLTKEELIKIKEMLDQEIKDAFGTQVPMFDEFGGQDEEPGDDLPHFNGIPEITKRPGEQGFEDEDRKMRIKNR
jgi:hypothetical protein